MAEDTYTFGELTRRLAMDDLGGFHLYVLFGAFSDSKQRRNGDHSLRLDRRMLRIGRRCQAII